MPGGERKIEVLYSAEAIAGRIEALAQEIVAALGRDAHLVAVLKGSFVFAADLIRALHRAGMRPRIDFLTLASYGESERSSGEVRLASPLADNPAGRTVLLIDDILDSGRTLSYAKDLLLAQGASAVTTCVLLRKATKAPPLNPDFVGFECPARFVVGYGLDYAHFYRELPYIGYLTD